ncbi:MAG: SDR family oxidoreductase [Candidatus Methanoperedens sp.]|nr:SDR family oxidoreductase [Candidatus Methanoperedens sp.]
MNPKGGIILVTGATGTLGTEVVKQLSKAGASVRAAVHTKEKSNIIEGEGIEFVDFDHNRPETLSAAFKGVEKLFLLTPVVDNMVEITSLLIEYAKNAGVKHIVKQSALGADANSQVNLLRWHREAERVIEKSGIPYTFLRPNVFMQNFVNSYGQTIKAQNTIYSPAGEGRVGFVDVRDIAMVAAKVLTSKGHEGKIYKITGPEAISYSKAAQILSEALGRKISFVNVSEEEARKGLKESGLPDWMVDGFVKLGIASREGQLSIVLPTVEDVTGRKPRSFSDFAKDYANALK